MDWEESTTRQIRSQPGCPACAGQPIPDPAWTSSDQCATCGYDGALPYMVPEGGGESKQDSPPPRDLLERDVPRKPDLTRRKAPGQKRREELYPERKAIPEHWIPVRPPGVDEEAFMALVELGWTSWAEPLDDVHLQGRLPL